MIVTGIAVFLAYFFSKVRKVPANTTIIIDRNTHFHKKKSYGYYTLNSKTDVITTKVSPYDVTETYNNVFETHDSAFFRIGFEVTYKSENVEMTLSSLEDSRRSIYDIVNCSMETSIAACRGMDLQIKTDLDGLKRSMFSQLENMLEPFYIDVINLRLLRMTPVDAETGMRVKFNRHISTSDDPLRNR